MKLSIKKMFAVVATVTLMLGSLAVSAQERRRPVQKPQVPPVPFAQTPPAMPWLQQGPPQYPQPPLSAPPMPYPQSPVIMGMVCYAGNVSGILPQPSLVGTQCTVYDPLGNPYFGIVGQ